MTFFENFFDSTFTRENPPEIFCFVSDTRIWLSKRVEINIPLISLKDYNQSRAKFSEQLKQKHFSSKEYKRLSDFYAEVSELFRMIENAIKWHKNWLEIEQCGFVGKKELKILAERVR